MKRFVFLTTVVVSGLSTGGCATQSAAHHHVATPSGPATRAVELPGVPGPGEPREVRVLVDEPPLKLATIVLRGGTVLPAHHSGIPVTIEREAR